MQNADESLSPLEDVAAVEVLSDDHSPSPGELLLQRDYAARVRASHVLKRYQSGFTPNLLPHADLMAFDAVSYTHLTLPTIYSV